MCWYKYGDLNLYLHLSLSHSLLKLTPLSLFLPLLCFIAYLSLPLNEKYMYAIYLLVSALSLSLSISFFLNLSVLSVSLSHLPHSEIFKNLKKHITLKKVCSPGKHASVHTKRYTLYSYLFLSTKPIKLKLMLLVNTIITK